MIVIADTTPLNYLVLIDYVGILPQLYGRVLIPPAVWQEFQRRETPEAVRAWLAQRPEWLEIRQVRRNPTLALGRLGAGEREAIALAEELRADRLILDDLTARRVAAQRNLTVIGTLGVLIEAAERGLVDFAEAIARLHATTFYLSPEVVEPLLDATRKNPREGDVSTDTAMSGGQPREALVQGSHELGGQ
jgi:predicted nucleic acid-binding protein